MLGTARPSSTADVMPVRRRAASVLRVVNPLSGHAMPVDSTADGSAAATTALPCSSERTRSPPIPARFRAVMSVSP